MVSAERPSAPQRRHSFSGNDFMVSGLCSGIHMDRCRTVNGGHFHVAAQCRHMECDGDFTMDLIAVTLEKFAVTHMHHDVKVAAGSTAYTGLPFPGDTHTGSRIDPGRDIDIHLAADFFLSHAIAFGTGFFRHLTGTVTHRTLMHHGEEALGHTDLPGSAAPTTPDFTCSGGTAGAVAIGTVIHACEFDGLSFTADGIHEIDFQIVTQIVAVFGGIGIPSSAAAEEGFETAACSAAEELIEDVEGIAAEPATTAAGTAARACSISQSCPPPVA